MDAYSPVSCYFCGMKLTYIDHSGYLLETENCLLVFDYFRSPDGGKSLRECLCGGKSVYVFASHRHPDHFVPEVLEWERSCPHIRYIFSHDIVRRKPLSVPHVVSLRRGGEYADRQIRVHAYGSTDIGVSFRVEVEGKLVFHAGDLNNWHWMDESTEQEVRKAEGDYLAILRTIAADSPRMYLAMLPIDPRLGTDFWRGARQFLARIACTYVAPMHTWGEYSRVHAAFRSVAEAAGAHYLEPVHPMQSFVLPHTEFYYESTK